MLKQLLLALGRGLVMLVAVYLPTFVLASAIVISVTSNAGGKPPALEAAIPLVIGISLGIALILMATVGGRQFRSFGFRLAGAKVLWWSLCLGLAVSGLLHWLAMMMGVQETNMAGLATWQVIVFFWVAAPVQEEVIFRGLLQGTLQQGFPGLIPVARWRFSVAAVVSAVAFALVHLALLTSGASPGTAAFVVVGALILGLLAGQLRWSTESLVPCFVIHALFNITGSIIGWLGAPR